MIIRMLTWVAWGDTVFYLINPNKSPLKVLQYKGIWKVLRATLSQEVIMNPAILKENIKDATINKLSFLLLTGLDANKVNTIGRKLHQQPHGTRILISTSL
jgi:hypothetical protein